MSIKFNTEPAYDDPFATDAKKKKEKLEFEIPQFTFSKKETNQVQRGFLQEVERKSLELLNLVEFYDRPTLYREDLAQYSLEEAQEIIKNKSRLNPEQINATFLCEGDLNIQALAGTGKTSMLSTSVAYLMALGYDPERIAISSHTVTAAEEIQQRIPPTLETLFPLTSETGSSAKLTKGTIHAIAYRELIEHKHPKARWNILEEGQQFRVWKESYLFSFPDRANLNVPDELLGEEMRLLDRVRGYDIPEKEVPKILEIITGSKEIAKTADTYFQVKEARKLLDYTDLLREWAPLIIHPGYTGKWEYFFVDEFQDTNPLQKFLLKLLKFSGAKLVVCGDNRQSINSFTGSDPTSHIEFFKSLGIKEAWLETNYRCNKTIIRYANMLLESMFPLEKGRLLANPNAEIGENPKLVMTKSWANRKHQFLPAEEAAKEKRGEAEISCREAGKMYELLEKELTDEKPSVAILYRTNVQGGILEEALILLNANRQKEGLNPLKYTRKDFRRTALRNKTEREVVNILSCWSNPHTSLWENILLSPYFPGIGEVTARSIQRKIDKNKPQTKDETEIQFENEFNKKSAGTILAFFEAWDTACKDIDVPTITTAVTSLQNWIKEQTLKQNFETGSTKESEAVQRRSYEAGIFDRLLQKEKQGHCLSSGLTEILEENEKTIQNQNSANRALGLTQTHIKQEKEDGIILSTIHLAKGREYDGVVIHQVSKGSLPHYNAVTFHKSEKNIREKRFRKYSCFPELQKPMLSPNNAEEILPQIERQDIQLLAPKTPQECWEDQNNPIEEEKRLFYVAITRAKRKLTITSKDYDYNYAPRSFWKSFTKIEPQAQNKNNLPF
jgi:superfamily I DNA/RNA helicase